MAQDKSRYEKRKEERALTIMAHDIKAPLSAIVSILGVIEKGYVKDIDKVKELVSRASQKAETIIAMVDDILDYTLLADKSMIKREPVQLFDVLKDSISTMTPYAKNRKITLTYNLHPCAGKKINGSYTFLLRAFNNIIMNAIKYNKQEGKIAIHFSQDTGSHTITITVEDTGMGIPEDELDKVFHISSRGKYARENINDGLGLGLFLVKQIIRDHDGEIELTSTVGMGTTVKITLPLLNFKSEKKGGTDEL
ncbi:MAG: HAMP domain-containing sensor histidine kinase [Candidatus Aminicenantes bacterium]